MTLDLRLALPDEHQAVGDNPVFAKCANPDHQDKRRPNMAVYADHLHCYACGFHLEQVPEQYRDAPWAKHPLAVLLGITNAEAVALEPKYASETLDAYRERAGAAARRDPLPLALAKAYHHLLFEGVRCQRMDWLYARGLTDWTVADFQLGHDGFRFVIPVFDAAGSLLTLRYRRDDAYQTAQKPKYCGLTGRNGFYLFPENLLVASQLDWVMVCEGELDAVRCWQEGWPAVSPTNGARQVPKVIAALQTLMPQVKTVVLATDQDEPGEEAAYVAGGIAEAAGLRVIRLRWDGAKDITDALKLGLALRSEDYRDGHGPAGDGLPARHAA